MSAAEGEAPKRPLSELASEEVTTRYGEHLSAEQTQGVTQILLDVLAAGDVRALDILTGQPNPDLNYLPLNSARAITARALQSRILPDIPEDDINYYALTDMFDTREDSPSERVPEDMAPDPKFL